MLSRPQQLNHVVVHHRDAAGAIGDVLRRQLCLTCAEAPDGSLAIDGHGVVLAEQQLLARKTHVESRGGTATAEAAALQPHVDVVVNLVLIPDYRRAHPLVGQVVGVGEHLVQVIVRHDDPEVVARSRRRGSVVDLVQGSRSWDQRQGTAMWRPGRRWPPRRTAPGARTPAPESCR